ncbi:hypothetical protein ACFQJ8_27265 [Halocatena marina]|uniref:hypothetical protein n=1 Tax=Halocatena marina TaxID=2934937 RepID=UPI00360B3ED8
MLWEASAAEISEEQKTEKDIENQNFSFSALFKYKRETTTETGRTNQEGSELRRTKSFNLCPDPMCENHTDSLIELTRWKLRNDSTREYSDKEIREEVTQVAEQSIHDYRIVAENVEEIYNSVVRDTAENKRSSKNSDETEQIRHTDTQGLLLHNN